MEVWAIANQKGGVGKTTNTVALGGLLASAGHRALMTDIDPHASLSGYFGHDPAQIERSSYDLFVPPDERRGVDAQAPIVATPTGGLDLIPAVTALDRHSGRIKGLGVALKRAITQLVDDYDYVLIDCPPVLGILVINALAACDRLILPVQTDFLTLNGLTQMLRTREMVLRARTAPLPYLIVPTLYDPRLRPSLDCLSQLRCDFQEHLWFGYLPLDPRRREASRAGLKPSHSGCHRGRVSEGLSLQGYLCLHGAPRDRLRAAAMGGCPNAKGSVGLSREIADRNGWHVDCTPGE